MTRPSILSRNSTGQPFGNNLPARALLAHLGGVVHKLKSVLSLAAVLLSAVSVHAQGTVMLENFSSFPQIHAPVTNGLNQQLIFGTGFLAQLYGGSLTATEVDLKPLTGPGGVGGTTTFNLAAGYFRNGYVVNNDVAPDAFGRFQLRVWAAPFATYEAAFTAGQTDNSVYLGKSSVFQTQTGTLDPLNPKHPTGIHNLGFAVTPVPEPSKLALLGLGAAALFFRRRK